MKTVKFYILSNKNKISEFSTGFSLVEMLLATCIVTVILSSLYSVFYTHLTMNLDQISSLDLNQSLRACLSIMEKEIRMTGYDPKGSAGCGIVFADQEEIAFTADLNGDGDLSQGGGLNDLDETIRYGINSSGYLGRSTQDEYDDLGSLLKSGRSESMSRSVQKVNFTYLDSRGDLLGPMPLSDSMRGRISAVIVTLGGRTHHASRRLKPGGTKRNVVGDQVIFPGDNDGFGREVIGKVVVIRNR